MGYTEQREGFGFKRFRRVSLALFLGTIMAAVAFFFNDGRAPYIC
jgi:hypothetical protein